MQTFHQIESNHPLESNMSEVKFQHPFTMIVTGPTGCGKTQWVKDLLGADMIEPAPQRIVFFYKRWQPLYDEMKCLGPIEFYNELPPNLDSDECFNPNVRNDMIHLHV